MPMDLFTYVEKFDIPEPVVKDIMWQIILILCEMDSKCQLMHMDMKPENVLIDPDTIEVRLCDLEFCVPTDDECISLKSYEVSTPAYRAPERQFKPIEGVVVKNGATRNTSTPWAGVGGSTGCAVGVGGVDTVADTVADMVADSVADMVADSVVDTVVDTVADMVADTEWDMEWVVDTVTKDGAGNIEPSRPNAVCADGADGVVETIGDSEDTEVDGVEDGEDTDADTNKTWA
ncbi:hypothetical protein MAR_005270 [Mya arenaria]|uniref:Serine/threonine-protein kinase 1 n=1 Tax=Mya arenaria TaxID=6604 RepID=A0ABY7EZ47_MYAAR|nr:hypothetical protein MAR_005270 [Mya arenaria]